MAVNGVQPVSGHGPNVRLVVMPYAPPQQMHGGPVKQFHSDPGEQAEPYPWEEWAGPRGPWGPAEADLISQPIEGSTLAAGIMAQDAFGDQTPYRTHGGPTIRGMETSPDPENNARVLMQSYEAHSVNTGASRKARQSSNPLEDQWQGFWSIVPGEHQLPPVPGQVSAQSGGFGANDYVNNAYHKQNPYGLDSSHRHRRYATGSIPGNYMWMRPGGRPMVKTLAGPARPPVGVGPFYGQDPTEAYGIEGAILMRPASEYAAPPGVKVSPPSVQDDSAPPLELW
jgi:hypothetical protein